MCTIGIHKFLPDGIVRVGGRSNSEALKRFTLGELKRSHDFRRRLPQHLRRANSEVRVSVGNLKVTLTFEK